jgi:hypothetical protein
MATCNRYRRCDWNDLEQVSMKKKSTNKKKVKVDRRFRDNWPLGFLGFLFLIGIPALLSKDWLGALWLAWVVWFIWFIPGVRRC